MRFDELNIKEEIIRATQDMGFTQASPIQEKAIPVVLEGKDMIGQAQTGTGKTAAFGIPALQMVDAEEKKLQTLVMCPTRELAIQVAEELRKLAKYMHGVKVLPVYGGQQITMQIRALKSRAGVQIVVGTPGRVMDLMDRNVIKLDNIKMVVLDEADEMLNMGFREDIESILNEMPEERQTVLFSATMPQEIRNIAKKYQTDAQLIKVVKKELTVENIEQYYCRIYEGDKPVVLSRFLDVYQPKLGVVFCNTKRRVDEVTEDLKQRGYFAEGLHGDLTQARRDVVMKAFRTGSTQILVATDVAARGIDVDNVDMIFNYDLPQDQEFYVHRIGRTGRAGRKGKAFSFVTKRDMYQLKEIERYCKTKIERISVPTLEEIKMRRTDSVFEEIKDELASGSLDEMREMIRTRLMAVNAANEQNVSNEDAMDSESEQAAVPAAEVTELDIAAALLKRLLAEANDVGTEEIREFTERREQRGRDGRRDERGRRDGRERKGARRIDGNMTRLFLNVGKKQNIRRGDILGAIAGESKINGSHIGAIDMFDSYSFVDVPKEMAKEIIKHMKNAHIKGKRVHIEEAGGGKKR
jgi:ATP-dependent RNA helicase DeaD